MNQESTMVERGSASGSRVLPAVLGACAALLFAVCPCLGDDAPSLRKIAVPPGLATDLGSGVTMAPAHGSLPPATAATVRDALRPVGVGSGFWNRHFLPSLERRFADFDRSGTDNPLGLAGVGLRRRDELSDRAQGDAQKAAEGAVTDWLLVQTEAEAKLDAWVEDRIDGWIDSMTSSRGRAQDGPFVAGASVDAPTLVRRERSPWRPSVSLGLSRSLPKARMSWRVGRESSFRFGVRAYGAAEIEWVRDRRSEQRLWAGWDGTRGDLQVQYRATF